MHKTKLSVNVNAIAHLRNRRSLPWPDLVRLCRIALDAGAYGITVHPRPDERHIRRADVHAIAELLRRDFPGREFNIEGYPSEDFLILCEAVRPDQVTLVPDDPVQSTSDHGWDCRAHGGRIAEIVARCQGRGMRVSIFLDADPDQAEAAAATGARRIELYTGPYGHRFEPDATARELDALVRTAATATAAGLAVNAGHDLTLANLPPLISAIPAIAEVSIGHALTADALEFGLAETVKRYRAACGDPVG